jgi:integration host factor subunit beta
MDVRRLTFSVTLLSSTLFHRETAMTKSDLVTSLAARTSIPSSRAEHIVNVIFDTMTEAFVNGEGVELRGFGSFSVREYKGYTGRNPRTGESVEVAPKRLPFFKVGKELKELVDHSRHS